MAHHLSSSPTGAQAAVKRAYLDHAAGSPLCPEAREAMLPWLDAGNPSALYEEGRRARQAIDEAREVLAGALGCGFGEVAFTSGGTEAMNWAVLGAAQAAPADRRTVLMSAIEHHCALNTREALERLGFAVHLLPVDSQGRLELASLDSYARVPVAALVVMHANNEVGSFQPVAEVRAWVERAGCRWVCDAVQSFLWDWGGVDALGADLVAVSAHKVRGPKGVGALYVKAGSKPVPLLVGGGQERELRAGTENVAGIVGFAAAVRAFSRELEQRRRAARDAFAETLVSAGAQVTAPAAERLSGHLHLRLPGVKAEAALMALDRHGVSAGSGAACSSGSLEPSHVLLAMGWTPAEAKEGLRFTFGPDLDPAEAQAAAELVVQVLSALVQAPQVP